jgi:N-acetylmuramoyl-L-alanine amidase
MMKAQRTHLTRLIMVGCAIGLLWPTAATAQTARARYEAVLASEHTVRALIEDTASSAPAAVRTPVLTQARRVIAAYEALVRRYHVSGYADNALFNAATLADTLYARFGQHTDRTTALRLYTRVAAEYPTSSLVKQIDALRTALDRVASAAPEFELAPSVETPAPAARRNPIAKLTAIERTVLPEAVRITLALDREVAYREEALSGPARVFFDLKGVEATPGLADAVLRYPSDAVRQIRVGRHPDNTVRVVLDLEGIRRHTVYALYNPFRLVIDAEPLTAAVATSLVAAEATMPIASLRPGVRPTLPPAPRPAVPPTVIPAPMAVIPTILHREPTPHLAVPVVPSVPTASAPSPAPAAPKANTVGGFSIARQLGLGVSRIVIDPGHGGHDPGALVKGLNEAELTLDIALRLEKLLQAEPGLEVVLTRRSNVYIPLEERTALANREGADLFLSIHANASRNTEARGVETYFLSFASSPDAESVAARENSASVRDMHTLPDIIKAIALNNKLDESRDLASMVQEALISRLRRSNKNVRNLGVKKAPFVVLIGAQMPSVLAEVSFLTNKQELQLLKTPAYKQRIAEALHAAVMRYRRSLKGQSAVASQ